MTAHEAVGDSVFKTTYADGSAVYVNYGAAAFESGGVRVEPQAYIVVRGTLVEYHAIRLATLLVKPFLSQKGSGCDSNRLCA